MSGKSGKRSDTEAADVARAAVWLASDKADCINGASIMIDGGMTL